MLKNTTKEILYVRKKRTDQKKTLKPGATFSPDKRMLNYYTKHYSHRLQVVDKKKKKEEDE